MAARRGLSRPGLPFVFHTQSSWVVPIVRRHFSASATRNVTGGTFPDFKESSSPELQTLLAVIRQKNLLPGYLTDDQYRLITKEKYRNQISQDPVHIEVDGIGVVLEHTDITKDIPDRKSSITKVLKLSKEENDFENLEKLLAAFQGMRGGRTIHAKLRAASKRAIVARLGSLDRISTVIKILRDPNRYGIDLKDSTVLGNVILGVQFFPARHNWDEHTTRSALSFAEQLVDMLERKEHGGDKSPRPQDPRRLPQVVALPLEMAATLVKNKQASQLETQKARDYAERLIGVLDQTAALESQLEERQMLSTIVPCLIVQNALKQALAVADEISLPNKQLARTVEERLRSAILKATRHVRDERTTEQPFSETTLAISVASRGLEI